jgi:hypothetical protein
MRKYIFVVGLMFVLIHLSAQNEMANWFPFQPSKDYTTSRINMEGWLHAPAGKYGPVQMKGDALSFENGKKLKFWGVNIASNRPFLPHADADKWTPLWQRMASTLFVFISLPGTQQTELILPNWQAINGRTLITSIPP